MSVSTGVPVRPSRAAELPTGLAGLVLLTLLLAPLPLASNRPLFEGLLSIVAAIGLILWGFHYFRTGQGLLSGWHRLQGPVVCVMLVLLWATLQLLPLPSSYAHPVWHEAAALLERDLPGRITVDPSATLIGLIKLATYIAFFALAYQVGRSTRLAGRLLRILFISASIYAAYGLIVYLSGNGYVLWLPKESYTDSLTGSYINRNAFAALCGMGLLAGATLLSRHLARELSSTRAAPLDDFVVLHVLPRIWLTLTGCLILLLALWLTHSRAGIVCAGIGGLMLALSVWRARLIPLRVIAALVVAVTLLIGGLMLKSGEQLLSRLSAAEFEQDERPGIWRSTVQMIVDAPLTGQGLGTYDQLFHVYRDEMTFRIYDHAHNSYLEMAAEIGLPATLLWFVALALIGRQLWRGVGERRQSQLYPAFSFAVLSMAACHSLLDFSYQMPANTVWLAVILGLGMAQSFSASEKL